MSDTDIDIYGKVDDRGVLSCYVSVNGELQLSGVN